MESLQSDAVPLDHQQVHDHSTHIPVTTPTLAPASSLIPEQHSEKQQETSEKQQEFSEKQQASSKQQEPSKNLDLEMEAVKLVEPVDDSGQDNNDLNSLDEAYSENSQDIETSEETTRASDNANTIVINNTSGVVHFGPTCTFQMQNTYTQVTNQPDQAAQEAPSHPVKDIPSKDFMRPLWYSTKLVEEADLMRLSKNIGSGWKALGNGLKFNWAQLEQFEKDTKSVSEAVYRMLFRWLQWRDQKATVGRLTKVLFNHNEYDAIRCLVDNHGQE